MSDSARSKGNMEGGAQRGAVCQCATDALHFVLAISTEPVAFLVHFAMSMKVAVQPQAIRDRVVSMYADDIAVDSSYETYNGVITGYTVMWNLANTLMLPLTMLTGAFLGAYSDAYGRQLNMLMGALSMALASLINMLVFSTCVNAPLYLLPAAFLSISLIGGAPLCYIAAMAFVPDSTPDKDNVAIRSALVAGGKWSGLVCGYLATSRLSQMVGIALWMLCVESLNVLAFAWILYRIPHVPPRQLVAELKRIADSADKPGEMAMVDSSEVASATHDEISVNAKFSYRDIWSMYKAAIMMPFRRRPGDTRLMIWLCFVVTVVASISIMENSPFIGIFVQAAPLKWGPRDFAQWNAIGIATNVFGTLVGTVVLKKVLKLPDTALMFVGILSVVVQMLPLVFLTGDADMYVAEALGMFDGITMPAMISFANYIVGPAELCKMLTAGFIMSVLGTVGVNLTLQPLYVHWQNTFPGGIFAILSLLAVAALACVAAVHYLAATNEVGNTTLWCRPARRQAPDNRAHNA